MNFQRVHASCSTIITYPVSVVGGVKVNTLVERASEVIEILYKKRETY